MISGGITEKAWWSYRYSPGGTNYYLSVSPDREHLYALGVRASKAVAI